MKCLICNNLEATKKNSHIIPSFLIAMVTSYDNSYKRDKEILFTIRNFKTQIYTGNLPSTEYERLFENLTEERINHELKINTASKDCIFCPICENNLSKYLESPYAMFLYNNKNISNEIPFIFWISVIWRMSITGTYGFKLSKDIENTLHLIIKNYFECKNNGGNFELPETLINYRMVYCKDFCKKNSGYIYAQYDSQNQILSLTIGDLAICFMFTADKLPKDFVFLGLESHFINAPVNKGKETEKRINVTVDVYQESIKRFIQMAVKIKISDDFKLMDKIWFKLHLFGYMPIRMKIKFLCLLYDSNVKIGERHTVERYRDILYYLLNNPEVWF